MSERKTGTCAICGDHKELSFEHVPPRSAFNNKPIHILNSDQMFEGKDKLTKDTLNQKGLGSYTLCHSCNNATGSWYGDSFKDFAKQGMEILEKREYTIGVSGVYIIKPLNVFKQIITMFLSADKGGYLRTEYNLNDFLLDKASNHFPDNINVYLYSNASPFKRFLGHCIVADADKVYKWAEINFQPFGYFLTEDSKPPNEFMVDITSWHKLKYNDIKSVSMTTAYLKVPGPVIGTYG